MKKILHIKSSPRSTASLSRKLGNHIVEKLRATYPGSTVVENDLVEKSWPHLEEITIASFFTPEEHQTDENRNALKHSDQAIAELMDADIIVIEAPLYNFSIHSTLKAWIDHIVRVGKTFGHNEQGAFGMVHGKKVYIAISSGWVYSEGPMKAQDFIEPYLRFLLGFLGMTDISVFRIEGANDPNLKDTAVEKGLASVVI